MIRSLALATWKSCLSGWKFMDSHKTHKATVSADSAMAVLPASNLLWQPWNCLVYTLKISHLLLTKSLTSELLLLFIWLIDAAAVASRNFRFNSATLAVCFDENWIDFKSMEKPFASAWNCDEVRIFSILSWPTF